MKKIALGIIIMLTACNSGQKKNLLPDSWYYATVRFGEEEFQQHYNQFRFRMEKKQAAFKLDLNLKSPSELRPLARKYLQQSIIDSLFLYWLDTPWDFYGTTEMPRQGNIACGYFVTTTLKHAGFNLNRVQLAQQAASVIIQTLCDKSSIKIISNGKLSLLQQYFKQIKEGLYIIGLDNHVGFIQKRDTSTFMIHASGSSPYQVVIENTAECRPILKSQFFMIGDLLGNDQLIDKWIHGDKIFMEE